MKINIYFHFYVLPYLVYKVSEPIFQIKTKIIRYFSQITVNNLHFKFLKFSSLLHLPIIVFIVISLLVFYSHVGPKWVLDSHYLNQNNIQTGIRGILRWEIKFLEKVWKKFLENFWKNFYNYCRIIILF